MATIILVGRITRFMNDERHIVYTFHPRGLREHGFDTSCFVCLEIDWIQQLCKEAMPTVQCEARERAELVPVTKPHTC